MWLNRYGIWSFIVALSYVNTAIANGHYDVGVKRSSWGPKALTNFECKEEGYYGDSSDCRLYYRCVDWGQSGTLTKFKFECGPGTVFSKQRGDICTHPEESGMPECGGSAESDKANDVDSNNMYDSETEEQSNSRPESPDQSYGPSYGSSAGPSYGPSYIPSPSPSYEPPSGSSYIPPSSLPPRTSDGPSTSRTVTPSKPASSNTESTNQSQLPTGIECQADGFLTDPEDCSKFYRCVDQGTGSYMRHAFSCGDGTVWDPQIEACNHPWAANRVNCRVSQSSGNQENENNETPNQASPNPDPNESSRPPTPPCQTETPPPSSEGVQGYPGNSPTPKPLEKPTSTPQRPEGGSQQGSSPSNEIPQPPETTSSEPQPTASPNGEPHQPESERPGGPTLSSEMTCTSEGFFGDAEDCSKFYRCVNTGSKFTKYEFKCGDGTVWDDKIMSCNHRYAVPRCGGADQGNGNGNEGSDGSNNEIQQGPDFGSSPGDSATSSGQPPSPTVGTTEPSKVNEGSTNTGETITSSSDVTENPSQSVPSSEATPGSSELASNSEKPSIESSGSGECTAEGFFPDPKDCSKFYRCVASDSKFIKYEFQCGEGTVWDEMIESCNHKSAVPRCGGSDQGTGSINQKPDEANNEIGTDQGNGNEGPGDTNNNGGQGPDSGSSSGDSTSSSGLPSPPTAETTEPSNLNEGLTNASEATTISSQVTENTSQTGPPIGTTPGSTDSSSTSKKPLSTGSSGNGECTVEGFFSNPKNCSKFYRCVKSGSKFTKYEFECGEGTVWDDKIASCNHKSAVPTCGGSDQGTGGETQRPEEINNEVGTDQGTSNGNSGRPNDTNNEVEQRPDSGSSSGDSTASPAQPANPTVGSTELSKVTEATTNSGVTSAATTASPEVTEDSSSLPSSSEASASEQPSTGSPGKGVCTREGFFSELDDCKKFYRCVAGEGNKFTKYEFTCGEGTVWDNKIQSCNHAYAVPGCGGVAGPTEGQMPGENPPSGGSTGDNVESGQGEMSTTAESNSGLTTTGSGDSTSTESSSSEQQPEETTSTTQASGESTESTSAGGNESPSESSTMAQPPSQSSEGTTSVAENQTPSNISPTTQSSSEPSEGGNESSSESSPMTEPSRPTSEGENESLNEVQTSSPPSSMSTQAPQSTTESSKNEQGEGNGDCNNEGFFPNKNDCRRFFRCVAAGGGKYTKYDFSCAPGTAWDQNILTCNHMHLVASCKAESNNEIGDGKEEGSSSTASTSGTDSSSNNPPSTESNLTSPGKPADVTKPDESTSEISSDATSESTDESSATESSTASSTSESSSENGSGTQPCDKPKPTDIVCNEPGFNAHPTRCDKFYRCVENGNGFNVYHFDCPPGTIFDPSISVCNYPESIYPARDCKSGGQGSPSSSTESSKGEEPSTGSAESSEGTTSTVSSSTIDSGEEMATTTEPTAESTSGETSSGTPGSTESAGTEGTTENSGESTTEVTTGTFESSTTEMTTGNSGESTTEISTETSGESTTEVSTETSGESTTEVSTETSGESTTGVTTENSGEEGTQSTSDQDESTTPTSTSAEPGATTESQGETTTETQEQSTTESQQESTESSEGTSTMNGVEEATSGSTESNESTTQEIPPGATPCPIGNLTGEQIVLVCPTGFKRHPKYCNIFYQCISEAMEVKILSFSCPENTIFDEEKIQCLPDSESSQSCSGVKAGARFYRRIESSSAALMRVEKRETLCPDVGHYPYRSGCSNVFYKCKRDSRNALQGYLYKCPQDFVYWSVSRRCERSTRLPMCASRASLQRDQNENDTSSSRWQLPVEDYNLSARMLRYPY